MLDVRRPFDLVLVRGDTGALERVQVKYTTSDGRVVMARCRSQRAWVSYQYQPGHVDWIATFDATTASISYVHSCEWGGWTSISLRLTPTTNGQVIGTSQMYASATSRDAGIDTVKANGPSTTVEVEPTGSA